MIPIPIGMDGTGGASILLICHQIRVIENKKKNGYEEYNFQPANGLSIRSYCRM